MLSMDLIPRFAPGRKIVQLDQSIFIRSPGQNTVQVSPSVIAICQKIDGVKTISEIINSLVNDFHEAEIFYRIKQLRDRGHLIDSLPKVNNKFNEDTLINFHIKLKKNIGHDVVIVYLNDPFDQDILSLIHTGIQNNKTQIIVYPYGDAPWVSTPLSASEGACPECLLFWLRQNKPVERFIYRQQQAVTLHHGQPQMTQPEAIKILSETLIKRLQEEIPENRAELVVWDSNTQTTQQHIFNRRPQCGHCGNPQLMHEKAGKAPKIRQQNISSQSAGLRSEDPSETYARLSHLVSPICGPVAYLHPMPIRHAESRYVYASGYLNCPRQLTGSNDFDKLCAGKGDRSDQSRTSAICETIERFSGVYQGDEYSKRSRQVALDEPSYGFEALQQFSSRQQAMRTFTNELTEDPRKQIPEAFDSYTLIDWTPSWSLTNKQRVWVPLGYCFADTPLESGTSYGIHNPNGSAAGAHIDEAILQGLLELIERDAVAIWWYNTVKRPCVNLVDFDVPYWNTLAAEYEKHDYDFWVLDLTHDLGIPCFTAIAQHKDGEHHAIGFGCHLDHRIAINRAITELNQLFDPSPNRVNPWNHFMLNNTDFLRPDPLQKPRGCSYYEDSLVNSTSSALEHCVNRLEKEDMEILVVDKSRPDLELKVAQVIVPGLRHFWPRFGPGRLYDVPVKMGWRDTPLKEKELNQALLFL